MLQGTHHFIQGKAVWQIPHEGISPITGLRSATPVRESNMKFLLYGCPSHTFLVAAATIIARFTIEINRNNLIPHADKSYSYRIGRKFIGCGFFDNFIRWDIRIDFNKTVTFPINPIRLWLKGSCLIHLSVLFVFFF